MSMKGKYILLLLAAAGTLSLAGCQKTGILGKTGEAVRFSASAGPAATKTVYSGENASGTAVQSGQVERIDWLVDDQPDPQESLEKLTAQAHGGEILLLHSVSSTNAQILGDLIDALREKGYRV